MMIYLAHPFTGDEEKNRQDARKTAAELVSRYPEDCFINPLDAMQHEEMAKIDYRITLEHTMTILSKCDSIIMLGDWQKSTGCRCEYMMAGLLCINIYDSKDAYIKAKEAAR